MHGNKFEPVDCPLLHCDRGESSQPRMLFASYHCYVDPSSGAAGSTRDMLQMLAARGWPTRVVCGPRLDHADCRSPRRTIEEAGLPIEEKRFESASTPFSILHLRQGDVPASVFQPDRQGEPAAAEIDMFLSIYERLLDTWHPDVLITYGGEWVGQRLMLAAKQRDIRVVFLLQNFSYHDARFFCHVDEVLVPSEFSVTHHRRTLNLQCTAIPAPIVWDRVRCESDPVNRFVTFVNPQYDKGVTVFARIAAELGRLRPDIPLLVVEGREGVGRLGELDIRLDGLSNLHRMANTPDPRDFYRVSKIILMPSLCDESFGRVAIESMANGIPLLGSDRGALAEVAGEGGFLFSIPAKYTPQSREIPSAEEVTSWVETILRLWDEPEFYDQSSARARESAEFFSEDRVAETHADFFRRVAARSPS